jgi:hypothetical protein
VGVAPCSIVIQEIGALDGTAPLDPLDFAFFKGLNDPAVGGILTADVTEGLAAGNYRMASIHTNANHAPAVAAVAQHGFFDDIVYVRFSTLTIAQRLTFLPLSSSLSRRSCDALPRCIRARLGYFYLLMRA